jgi:DNA-binding response OmpR family regulator
MGTHLPLVEDDDGIAAPLERALAREGYEVVRAADGAGAVADLLGPEPPLLTILDLGLPDMDGLDVCRQARDGGYPGPILILTARGAELDRVVGLDSGADDYLAKPVSLAELLARVRALLRRSPLVDGTADASSSAPSDRSNAAAAPTHGAIGRLQVDEVAHRVLVGDTELSLSAKEFALLALLVREAGRVVTRERIMEEVWDEHWFGSTKTLDVTLGRLRGKLDPADPGVRIVSVRGVGFRLELAGLS